LTVFFYYLDFFFLLFSLFLLLFIDSIALFNVIYGSQCTIQLGKGLVAELAPRHIKSAWGSRGGKDSSCRVSSML